MKFVLDWDTFDFSDEDLDYMYLAEGEEGICYRVKIYDYDFVMKLFHSDTDRSIISEDDCKKLISIDTQRIVTPDSLVYDEDGNYIGYASKYIKYKKPRIKNLKIGKLLKEFELLEEDTRLLTNRDFDISDLNYNNTIFSDGIFMCDVSAFCISDNPRFLASFNKETLTDYELNSILFELFKFSKKEQERIRELVSIEYEGICDLIRSLEPKDDEDVITFFKTRINR